jgi:hypothetical protein
MQCICSYCRTSIPLGAVICPNCRSSITPAGGRTDSDGITPYIVITVLIVGFGAWCDYKFGTHIIDTMAWCFDVMWAIIKLIFGALAQFVSWLF